ncbi:MAG: Holliday junction branch migration protein RuvA [Candidatus Peribacteraceae bacterium]|nr:Holliday junction branch migration protein RuvA [Candidatus Peribacteraceae bacterium]
MIHSLRGIAHRLTPPQVSIDVQGVGYLLTVPLPVWEKVAEGQEQKLIVHTYVREDRLDLFGFLSEQDRSLFVQFISLSGIGPKLALELCSISRNLLMQAIAMQDANILAQVKGVGQKKAEKLLLELKSIYEKHPDSLTSNNPQTDNDVIDRDALAALLSLGYDQNLALKALQAVSADHARTEDRVTAALRSLATNRKISAVRAS